MCYQRYTDSRTTHTTHTSSPDFLNIKSAPNEQDRHEERQRAHQLCPCIGDSSDPSQCCSVSRVSAGSQSSTHPAIRDGDEHDRVVLRRECIHSIPAAFGELTGRAQHSTSALPRPFDEKIAESSPRERGATNRG